MVAVNIKGVATNFQEKQKKAQYREGCLKNEIIWKESWEAPVMKSIERTNEQR